MKTLLLVLTFALTIMIYGDLLFAHKTHRAADEKKENKETAMRISHDALHAINTDYIKNIKSIFRRNCFNCHSDQTHYPWYYKVPGAKKLIDHDIRKARKYMDMSHDFPFGGHGSPKGDLKRLKEIVEDGSMPPLRYRVMHWNSVLTEQDKNTIIQWIERSQRNLP